MITFLRFVLLDFYCLNCYVANVSEDSTPYAEVIRIHATDRDSGSNARIQYTFENGNDGNGDFTIDFYTGRIRTNGMYYIFRVLF